MTRLLSNDFIYTNRWLTSPGDTLMGALQTTVCLVPSCAREGESSAGRKLRWRRRPAL